MHCIWHLENDDDFQQQTIVSIKTNSEEIIRVIWQSLRDAML